MEAARFWALVEEAKKKAGVDFEERVEALREVLMEIPPEEVLGFAQSFQNSLAESYDEKLWGAAYLLNGGCSDDGFDYFRAWLISEGEENYRRALADPESLADFADPEVDLEMYMYVPGKVYKELTGQDMPDFETQPFPELKITWDEEDLPEIYPRIAEFVDEDEDKE